MAKQERTSKADRSTDLSKIRHSASHILAEAVLRLYPDTQLAFGPATEDGFYYDFEFSSPLSEQDLEKLEREMEAILKEGRTFEPTSKTVAEAKKWAKTAKQTYKIEQIDELTERGEKELSFYQSGPFIDLCAGPHVKDTSVIGAFKLMSLAGAYWKGSEKNKMLTRIYGTAFATPEELVQHLELLEEAKKRDHKKLGRELGLFSVVDEVGPGLPLFYPKGMLLRKAVEDFISELQTKSGYEEIWIPHVTKGELYKISGHLDKYDAMYPPMNLPDGEGSYYLKPMNCPHFMMLYKTTPHSYKELPVRWTCTTTNYRYEKSGELAGLTRVRSLTQDDCHVFTQPENIEQEIELMLDMIDETYKAFGFHDFWVRVSTRDPQDMDKYIGDTKVWDDSEKILEQLIKKRKWDHKIGEGEAAFYGPKLDFMVEDALGREWQLSTIQLDMNLPERFDLEYIESDGKAHRPVVIHRAILGSTERFLGILIEHFAGKFPLWVSPVQAAVLPISEKHLDYAEKVTEQLRDAGIRIELNSDNNSVGKKIREAEMQKTPYMLIVGDKEAEAGTVAVRSREKDDMGPMKVDKFIKLVADEVKRRVR